ncbi:hypothetical protein PX52LOC_00886 [Limnoglobus roseus]|uniref:Uncharacterized protein n=1 Tax=Limnoglobus roseus TaxID=2598579 RepID=A0A5C1AA77_9BACT|nr:hypothetical protein PX52LOC_00886 [Limnoglobus roseus]
MRGGGPPLPNSAVSNQMKAFPLTPTLSPSKPGEREEIHHAAVGVSSFAVGTAVRLNIAATVGAEWSACDDEL